uniref:Uncharacterized protein n=1 Tax=Plectus sambesii TaxID=2011161 RepID=A0A914WFS6_9BILA
MHPSRFATRRQRRVATTTDERRAPPPPTSRSTRRSRRAEERERDSVTGCREPARRVFPRDRLLSLYNSGAGRIGVGPVKLVLHHMATSSRPPSRGLVRHSCSCEGCQSTVSIRDGRRRTSDYWFARASRLARVGAAPSSTALVSAQSLQRATVCPTDLGRALSAALATRGRGGHATMAKKSRNTAGDVRKKCSHFASRQACACLFGGGGKNKHTARLMNLGSTSTAAAVGVSAIGAWSVAARLGGGANRTAETCTCDRRLDAAGGSANLGLGPTVPKRPRGVRDP